MVKTEMTGFSKESFSSAYQLAFRQAYANTLSINDVARISLSNIADVLASRRLTARRLATSKITFDVTVQVCEGTCSPQDLNEKSALLASTAADPSTLVKNFETQQTQRSLPLVEPSISQQIVPTPTPAPTSTSGRSLGRGGAAAVAIATMAVLGAAGYMVAKRRQQTYSAADSRPDVAATGTRPSIGGVNPGADSGGSRTDSALDEHNRL